MEGEQQTVYAQRAFRAFSRAARAGRLYEENNEALRRLNAELQESFQVALEAEAELAVSVEPTCLTIEGQPILEEEDRDSSIPFTFYRDGIRRLTLRRGLPASELAALVDTTRRGLFSSGFGEDIASLLWRLDLDHVNYVVIDTSIVTAQPDGTDASTPMGDQINVLMESLFGGGDITEQALSFHLDQADLPAKMIADALDRVEDMAPGLHPSRHLAIDPAYKENALREIAEEGHDAVTLRGLAGALESLGQPLTPALSRSLGRSLLDLLDGALLERRWDLASRLVRGVRTSSWGPEWIAEWMAAAASETRFRHMAALFRAEPDPDNAERLLDYLRSAGTWAVEPMLAILPGVPQLELRRAISDLIMEFGRPRVESLLAAFSSGHEAAIVEAAYIASRLSGADAASVRAEAVHHENPKVRAALADHAHNMETEFCTAVLIELGPDHDPEVRLAVLRALVRRNDAFATEMVAEFAQKEALLGRAADVKRAQLAAYGRLAQEKSVVPLARFLRDGQRRLSGQEAEDMAVGAAWGLAQVRAVAAVEHLKRASQSKNRRISESARRALTYMKERL